MTSEDDFTPFNPAINPSPGQSGVLSGTIGIVGVGLMGGSLGLALKQANLPVSILGIGRSPEKLETAVKVGAIDAWEIDLESAVNSCNVVVPCTAISHIVHHLPEVLAAAKPDAVITDIGSTKTAIVAAARSDPRFVGGHPMCGSERTGVEAAVPGLYNGATWALTPTSFTSDVATDTLLALIATTGAIPLRLDPHVHDAMVAITSHVPHVLATTLIRTAGASRDALPGLYSMSAGSFADATRVAASPADIWRDVCMTNRDAVLTALSQVREQLDAIAAAVESSDSSAIEAFFQGGREEKSVWQAERRRA